MSLVSRSRLLEGQHAQNFGELPEFELRRSQRKTLAIQVQADGSVLVRAPRWLACSEIDSFLLGKREWILSKQGEAQRRYRDLQAQRESLRDRRYFLGDCYALEVRHAKRPRVEIQNERMRVYAADQQPDAVSRVLERWYGRRAREVLPERLEPCMQRVRDVGLPHPELRFRKMRSRWGSCSSLGRITLNTELIKADIACIDYVLTHELCHLREMNHGPRFYALMDKAMPDWREHKHRLESISIGF